MSRYAIDYDYEQFTTSSVTVQTVLAAMVVYHSTCRCTFDHTYTYINRGSLYLDSSVCTRVHAPTQEWLMRVRCDAIPREAKPGFRSVEFSRYDLGKGAPIPKRLYGALSP